MTGCENCDSADAVAKAELLVPEERAKGRIYGLTDEGERVHTSVVEVDAGP